MSQPPNIEVRLTESPEQSTLVGTLVERERRTYFEYDRGWLELGFELSPFSLKGRPGLIEHTPRDFGPLPGLFDDSLPDGWGLLLMDRHFRRIGLDTHSVSPLQRLAWLGTRTMGALTYHPPASPAEDSSEFFDLRRLSLAADAVYKGKATDVLPQLLRAGGSPAGARPKVLVGFDPDTGQLISGEGDLPEGHEHWLVKFSGREDGAAAGPIEFAYSMMARAAGLEMPTTRLFETTEGDRFFGVKRFDRCTGNRRLHVHTFGNLIESNFRLPSCDYSDFLKATTFLTNNHTQVLRAFRWMAFNVYAHNRDDHVKNFAYLYEPATRSWLLSPAYDLTFSHGPGGEHSMTVQGEGKKPDTQGMLDLAKCFDIEEKKGKSICEEVRQAIAGWSGFANDAGVDKRARDEIAGQHNA